MAIINNLPPKKKGGGWQITADFNTKSGTTHSYSENVVLPNINAEVSSRYAWSKDYAYNGSIQSVQVPKTGRYLLEAWGGQGGAGNISAGNSAGGYGGYSVGEIELQAGTTLYICCGGQGTNGASASAQYSGGYNGGGTKTANNAYSIYGGSGGGATSVALRTGLISALYGYANDILIVAGGGGGGSYQSSSRAYQGGNGGGTTGGTGQGYSTTGGKPGTQITGGQAGTGNGTTTNSGFGKGGNSPVGAGGGGLYGGGGGNYTSLNYFGAGGGGSGYLNSLLTNASTKNSGTPSSTPTSNYLKQGAGAVHIELLEEITPQGYSVTLTNTNTDSFDVYDGQDDTGTFLGTISENATENYTITSGYIYINTEFYQFYNSAELEYLANPTEITEDCSLEITTGGGSND